MQVTVEQNNIHWEAAHALVQAAVKRAEELEVRVNVAVVDSGGRRIGAIGVSGATEQQDEEIAEYALGCLGSE